MMNVLLELTIATTMRLVPTPTELLLALVTVDTLAMVSPVLMTMSARVLLTTRCHRFLRQYCRFIYLHLQSRIQRKSNNDDEYNLSSDNCNTKATCTNTAGSFTCACDSGYNGDGVTCTDNDECTDDTNNCDVNATSQWKHCLFFHLHLQHRIQRRRRHLC